MWWENFLSMAGNSQANLCLSTKCRSKPRNVNAIEISEFFYKCWGVCRKKGSHLRASLPLEHRLNNINYGSTDFATPLHCYYTVIMLLHRAAAGVVFIMNVIWLLEFLSRVVSKHSSLLASPVSNSVPATADETAAGKVKGRWFPLKWEAEAAQIFGITGTCS